jgi:hypothetical protein
MRRATKALMNERAHDLLGIILDGAEGLDLLAYIREQETSEESPWKLTDGEKPMSYSQIRRYVNLAEKLLEDNSRTTRRRLLRKHKAQRRRLYATAVQQGDVRAASAVLKDLAELQGLYPPKKIAPTNPKGDAPYEPFTDADRLAALQALYARVGAPGGGPPTPGHSGTDGPLLGGPGTDHGGRGDEPGPLAGETSEGGAGPDVTPLFETER